MTPFAIAALLIAGLATLYAIWRALRHGAKPNESAAGLAVAILLLLLMGALDTRDKRITEIEDLAQQRLDAALLARGHLPRALSRLTVDLNDCPPRTDGMTDQIVMTITTQADRGGPIVTGCSRIAERPLIARKPQ